MINHSEPQSIASSAAKWLDTAALIGVIAMAAVRMLVSVRNMWLWQVGKNMPMTDIGPIGTAITDGLCVATLMLAVIGALIGRRKPHGWWLLLWLCGAAGAMAHVWMGTGNVFIAGSWIGATALGLAAMIVSQSFGGGGRRMILAAIMALGVAIGIDSVWQVTVQHEWTVQNYLENRQQVLQSHGWQAGSIEQQKFETRLMQNEATGAVGLSNVFGTAAGAVTLLGIGWLAAVWQFQGVEASEKRMRRRIRAAVAACALGGPAALACTFSKGAILACTLVGVTFAVVAWWTRSKTAEPGAALRSAPAWWRNVAFFVVALGVAAVVGRWWVLGIQTTPGGERSLLFRGFYWQAAAKMVTEQPITGIGPGRFQDIYTMLKNPLSPEDVAQPHNVEIAWVSQLGLAGWAWVLMVAGMLWRAGGGVDEWALTGAAKRESAARWEIGIIAAGLAFGTQYVVQFAEMLPETVVMWMIGGVMFALMVGYAPAMKLNERWLSIGVLAAATVALLHSQIDMGLTNVSTAPVLMVVIGAAAAPGSFGQNVEPSAGRRAARWAAGGLLVLIVVLLGAWGLRLQDASMMHDNAVRRLYAYQQGDFASAAMPSRLGAIDEPRIVNMMGDASLIMARHDERRRADWLYTGYMHYLLAQHQPMHRAALARGEAMYDTAAWELSREPTWRDRAIAAATEALVRDPYSTRAHIAMAEVMEKLGKGEAAASLYAMAMELDAKKYLDPDSQLSDAERKDLQRRMDRLR